MTNVFAKIFDLEVLHSWASFGGGTRGTRHPHFSALGGQPRKCPHTFQFIKQIYRHFLAGHSAQLDHNLVNNRHTAQSVLS